MINIYLLLDYMASMAKMPGEERNKKRVMNVL